jgi:hypothetical protein
MMNRDICNNNESYEIYKKVGSNNSKKMFLDVETKKSYVKVKLK